MAAPRGGWQIATLASLALLLLAGAVSSGPLETLSIDLIRPGPSSTTSSTARMRWD